MRCPVSDTKMPLSNFNVTVVTVFFLLRCSGKYCSVFMMILARIAAAQNSVILKVKSDIKMHSLMQPCYFIFFQRGF